MRYSNIFLIVHLIVNISCANLKLETIIENEKNDVLAGESFLRYSANRIKLVQGKGNLIQTAVTYCHQNKISKGLEILRQNLLKEKENPNYWNHVGTCYYLLNSFAKSKYYLKIALAKGINLEIEKTENKSTFYPAYNNLGLIYLKLRDYDKALLYFKLADKNGHLLTPKFNMIQLYLKFGQINKALTLAKSLYKKASLDVDIISSLGAIHLIRGDYKKAFHYYSKIDKKYFDRDDISAHYAIVLFKLGMLEEAKSMLQKGQYTQIPAIKKMRQVLGVMIENELKLLKEIKYGNVNLVENRS